MKVANRTKSGGMPKPVPSLSEKLAALKEKMKEDGSLDAMIEKEKEEAENLDFRIQQLSDRIQSKVLNGVESYGPPIMGRVVEVGIEELGS